MRSKSGTIRIDRRDPQVAEADALLRIQVRLGKFDLPADLADSSAVSMPEGTVTVLFTDLVDSTQLNQRLGDESRTRSGARSSSARSSLIERQRGVVVKGLGDGLMVAFQSARRAVACAREIQLAVARPQPRRTRRNGR